MKTTTEPNAAAAKQAAPSLWPAKIVCAHDTNHDGDCHLCAKQGGCPLIRHAGLIDAAPELRFALSRIIAELPHNRDWLDPDIERIAKGALAKSEARE